MDAGLTTLYTDPVVTPAPITVTSSDYAPQSGASGGGSGGGSSGGFTTSVANTTSNGVTTTTTSTGTTGQVLGISTYNFASDLHIGMRSNDVLELQKRLAAEGFFAVNPTGYFGTITRFSAKIYQATHRIQPLSGFVGPLTRAELNK
jgi:peptidoglycan hydrolase-like protein with peptidoglycan-binding domain